MELHSVPKERHDESGKVGPGSVSRPGFRSEDNTFNEPLMRAGLHCGGISTRAASNKMRLVRQLGQEGEAAADFARNTTRIPSLTGAVAYRIPDGLNHTSRLISEVKNISRLSYTKQLRDYVQWTQANGYTFEL